MMWLWSASGWPMTPLLLQLPVLLLVELVELVLLLLLLLLLLPPWCLPLLPIVELLAHFALQPPLFFTEASASTIETTPCKSQLSEKKPLPVASALPSSMAGTMPRSLPRWDTSQLLSGPPVPSWTSPDLEQLLLPSMRRLPVHGALPRAALQMVLELLQVLLALLVLLVLLLLVVLLMRLQVLLRLRCSGLLRMLVLAAELMRSTFPLALSPEPVTAARSRLSG
mmetsp:Transcript_15149/g.33633  ORF Transcript_15149/g.33633 Transcript_15149/m.33633 type:complete len:225 (-) Transcript_15149:118-792(-)